MREARAQTVFREAVALGEEANRGSAAGHSVPLLRCNPRLAANVKPVLIRRHVVELKQLAPFGPLLHFLNLIVVVAAADRSIVEIG